MVWGVLLPMVLMKLVVWVFLSGGMWGEGEGVVGYVRVCLYQVECMGRVWWGGCCGRWVCQGDGFHALHYRRMSRVVVFGFLWGPTG